MEQISALASLILASLVVMGSPGPSTMSITAVGAAFGFHRSLSYASGLILGTTTVLAAVAAGVVAMLLSLPRLAPALVIASAIYILYLAYKIATAPPLSKQDRAARVPSATGGFLLGIANPKAYFAIAAVFAGSNLAVSSRVAEAALKFAVLAVMIVLIHLAWLTAGASLSHLLHHPVRSRIANLMFAAILVATTILAIARS